MTNKFPHNEPNPLQNFSVDPNDRMINQQNHISAQHSHAKASLDSFTAKDEQIREQPNAFDKRQEQDESHNNILTTNSNNTHSSNQRLEPTFDLPILNQSALSGVHYASVNRSSKVNEGNKSNFTSIDEASHLEHSIKQAQNQTRVEELKSNHTDNVISNVQKESNLKPEATNDKVFVTGDKSNKVNTYADFKDSKSDNQQIYMHADNNADNNVDNNVENNANNNAESQANNQAKAKRLNIELDENGLPILELDKLSLEQKEAYNALKQAKEKAAQAVDGNFLLKMKENYKNNKEVFKAEKNARKLGIMPLLSIWQKMGQSFLFMTSLSVKMLIAGLCVSALLLIYFDAVVIDKYEVDDKWVLPAVVYSRPLELYPDQRLSLKQMVYELELLKYRKVDSPRRAGEYAYSEKTDRIVLIKRPFTFPDGEEPRLSVLVEFDGKRVKRISNAETKQELAFMRMDPVLLDRINRINPQEDRIFISIEEVPKALITTLIEIEDRSYYQHFGINPVAIVRAFVKNTIAGRVVEGGSTITQQLVKNYFLTNERSYSRKLKEIFMAIAMNNRYTKDQILEAYMNEIYLGQNGNAGIYGFGLASYFYFGVPVSELNLNQIALLVGLIKGPSYYDPWRKPQNAIERRNTVLAVLRNRGHISEEQFEIEAAKPLNIIARGQLNYSKTPAFMGLVKTEIGYRFKDEEERTGKDFLSGNGIRIFTSLDPLAQVSAEKAVTQEIAAIEKERKLKNLEAAMIVSSWRTGEVSAVVGSSNPKYDGYNRVLDSKRQVGSLIKPFVYLTAFHQGYHLGSMVNDSPVKVKLPTGDIWAPNNDDKKFRGPLRVIDAMARSLNVPTVRIGMGAGLDNVVNTLKAAGYKKNIPLYPSIVLGVTEMSPYELNAMYVGMATEGIYRDLTTLRTIVKDGEIVYQRGSNRSARTLDPKDTYLAIYGMTEATRTGTGRRLGQMFKGVTIASKTGTTNDHRDSWSVGIDSDEIATVWVGYDNNKSTGLYGSSGAQRLYGAYLKERGVNSLKLKKPEGIIFVNFDQQGNVLANGCEEYGMDNYPARADRIQFVKQCNNFGVEGYNELPYVVPGQVYHQDGSVSGTPRYQAPNNMQMMPMSPANKGNVNQGSAKNLSFGATSLGDNSGAIPNTNKELNTGSNINIARPADQRSQAGFASGPYKPNNNIQIQAPSNDALNSVHVQDSQAKDVEPVKPDNNARPTQSSSQNVQRQADAFEDELLGF